MDPLLHLFFVALGTSIIVAWLFPYLMDVLRRRVFGSVIANGQRYFTHLRESDEPWPRITGKAPRALDRAFGWAGVRRFFIEPAWILIFIFLFLLFSLFLFHGSGIVVIVLFLLGIFFWVVVRAKHRQRAFVDALPQALDVLTQALRVGYSFPQAVTFVARETHPPVRHAFRALERGFTYRVPLRQTLSVLEDELLLPEWDLVAESLLIQERTGGNIIPILADVASTIRQNASIEHEMLSATAAGRMSGFVIAMLIPVAFIAFYFFNPLYMQIFFTTGLGQFLLGIAMILEVIGFVVIRRITRITY